MNNFAKFLITALLIIAAAFAFKLYKSGGFKDFKPVPTSSTSTDSEIPTGGAN